MYLITVAVQVKNGLPDLIDCQLLDSTIYIFSFKILQIILNIKIKYYTGLSLYLVFLR